VRGEGWAPGGYVRGEGQARGAYVRGEGQALRAYVRGEGQARRAYVRGARRGGSVTIEHGVGRYGSDTSWVVLHREGGSVLGLLRATCLHSYARYPGAVASGYRVLP